jgi:hypothetical protein
MLTVHARGEAVDPVTVLWQAHADGVVLGDSFSADHLLAIGEHSVPGFAAVAARDVLVASLRRTATTTAAGAAIDGDPHALGQTLAIAERTLGDGIAAPDPDVSRAAADAMLSILAAQALFAGVVPPTAAPWAWPLTALLDLLPATAHGLARLDVPEHPPRRPARRRHAGRPGLRHPHRGHPVSRPPLYGELMRRADDTLTRAIEQPLWPPEREQAKRAGRARLVSVAARHTELLLESFQYGWAHDAAAAFAAAVSRHRAGMEEIPPSRGEPWHDAAELFGVAHDLLATHIGPDGRRLSPFVPS